MIKIKNNRTLNIRRVNSRRLQERREIPFQFNSDEWVEALEKNKGYVLWPANDRRRNDRRAFERRTIERRSSRNFILDEQVITKEEIDYIYNLLSKKEVKTAIRLSRKHRSVYKNKH